MRGAHRAFFLDDDEKSRAVELLQSQHGRFAGKVKIAELSCPNEHVFSHGVPGEPPLWTLTETERRIPGSLKAELSIRANTIQVVTLTL